MQSQARTTKEQRLRSHDRLAAVLGQPFDRFGIEPLGERPRFIPVCADDHAGAQREYANQPADDHPTSHGASVAAGAH